MFSSGRVLAGRGRGLGAGDRAGNIRDPLNLSKYSDRPLDEGQRDPEFGAVPSPGFDREISAHGRDEAVRDHEAQAVARRLVIRVRNVESVEEGGDLIGVDSRSVVNE